MQTQSSLQSTRRWTLLELYLLDTDICSYIINGHSAKLAERFDHTFPFQRAISAITYAEILTGLHVFPAGHPRLRRAGAFLATIRVLDWGSDPASLYASLWIRMEREGTHIGRADIMIAAHAIALDATLVTNNTRHFSRIGPPLKLENWQT